MRLRARLCTYSAAIVVAAPFLAAPALAEVPDSDAVSSSQSTPDDAHRGDGAASGTSSTDFENAESADDGDEAPPQDACDTDPVPRLLQTDPAQNCDDGGEDEDDGDDESSSPTENPEQPTDDPATE
ncbi:hypothetical protein, partial [Brachybacterium vulturis]|uniref:hypothetical protein n=1 Tax=Brachybacterium vulturis TaxID=2017484 RepID=UPI00373699DF